MKIRVGGSFSTTSRPSPVGMRRRGAAKKSAPSTGHRHGCGCVPVMVVVAAMMMTASVLPFADAATSSRTTAFVVSPSWDGGRRLASPFLPSAPSGGMVTPTGTAETMAALRLRPPSSPSGAVTRHGVWPSGRSSSRLGAALTSLEQLNEFLPSKGVIEAVEKSKSGKVIAADVASTAGVSLSQARKELTALATISQGDIAVSSDGELIYTFPSNLNGVLSSNSAKYKLRNTWEKKVAPVLFYGVRVSFGIMLLLSIAAIFSTIALIQTSSSSDDDRRDRRGGGMGFSPGFFGPSPLDFFYYRPYGYYYNRPVRRPILGRRRGGYYIQEEEQEMGFLESVFSYIFGDGDPNQGLEEKRLRLAAKVIRDNKGSVTAEQLAPFCDAPRPSPNVDDEEDASTVDERFVLPIVTQLGGEPQVTEDGDIVYVFPELQLSAESSSSSALSRESSGVILERAGLDPDSSSREIKRALDMAGIDTRGAFDRTDLVRLVQRVTEASGAGEEDEGDVTSLQEREYKFSEASDIQKVLAGGLGVVNLVGALYLGNLLASPAMAGVQLPSYFGLVQGLYPFLLAYAVLFNVIPLVRNFWIKQENEKIRARNTARRTWWTMLQSSVGRISRKIRAAQRYAKRTKRLGQAKNEIIFDTKQDVMEREAARETDALRDFDKMLDGGKKNEWE